MASAYPECRAHSRNRRQWSDSLTLKEATPIGLDFLLRIRQMMQEIADEIVFALLKDVLQILGRLTVFRSRDDRGPERRHVVVVGVVGGCLCVSNQVHVARFIVQTKRGAGAHRHDGDDRRSGRTKQAIGMDLSRGRRDELPAIRRGRAARAASPAGGNDGTALCRWGDNPDRVAHQPVALRREACCIGTDLRREHRRVWPGRIIQRRFNPGDDLHHELEILQVRRQSVIALSGHGHKGGPRRIVHLREILNQVMDLRTADINGPVQIAVRPKHRHGLVQMKADKASELAKIHSGIPALFTRRPVRRAIMSCPSFAMSSNWIVRERLRSAAAVASAASYASAAFGPPPYSRTSEAFSVAIRPVPSPNRSGRTVPMRWYDPPRSFRSTAMMMVSPVPDGSRARTSRSRSAGSKSRRRSWTYAEIR